MKNLYVFMLLALLIGMDTNAQVKIDSLGFHLGTDNEYIINAPDKSTEEIRSIILEHAKENNWEVSNNDSSDHLRISMSDNFMVYNRRHGEDGYVGQNTVFDMDFKDGKCRIRDMVPEFFFVTGRISDRPEFIKEKKKKPFLITGNGNTLYDRDLVLRRTQRKIKPQIESYYVRIINGMSEKLNKPEKPEW